ncbi:hypothetical protein [Ferviditalea candida]|uniref:NorR-like AAA+ ATPase lid domain-containing protein n=1 Tax=Ferviditalea candida TaxID=3108399 RepID=A0ABU5ZN60_9BACL|nr:hypothetical protein [Paenibacillaceae bacterium T2]
MAYHWPGNVRELHSVLNDAIFLAEGDQIKTEHFKFDSVSVDRQDGDSESTPSLIEAEMMAIKKSLELTSRNHQQGGEAASNWSQHLKILDCG